MLTRTKMVIEGAIRILQNWHQETGGPGIDPNKQRKIRDRLVGTDEGPFVADSEALER